MATSKRTRLTREDRQRQLLDLAWLIAREEGTESLTLGRLAERAEVTKPVVYDHFGTRSGLLIALYQEYDARQTALMDSQLERTPAKLEARAQVIAASYVDCVLSQGTEIAGVIAALAGSPELEQVKREWEAGFMKKLRKLLAPFGGKLSDAGLWAMLGSAESLSSAAAREDISASEAKRELYEAVLALVKRKR
ncbi:MAG: TetR/AcrR family transcriptional regulator [Polyangiales bacterium]